LYGIERESYALDEVVIKRKIRVRGESVDISDLVNEEFKKLAVNTLAEVNSIWNIAEFDALILSGGGGQSLSPFMLPHLPHGRLAKNPLSSNCSGYYNWGVKLWK
jgi:plasmid segregation protein ParM